LSECGYRLVVITGIVFLFAVEIISYVKGVSTLLSETIVFF
jgi:hypothetical protein